MRVDHRGAEEERAVDELGPLVAPDVVRDRCLFHRAEQPRELADAGRDPSIELAEHEGAVAAVEDPSRRHPVRRPVDQAAHGPPGADGLRDQLLAQPVLERDDRPAGRQPWGDLPERVDGVMTLDGEKDELEIVAEAVGGDGPHADRGPRAVPVHGEPTRVDGLDVGSVAVHEEDLVPRPREGGTRGAPDRASAVDGDHHRAPEVSQGLHRVNAAGG